MNQSNSSKQILLSVIGVAILVVAVVGVSFAFFNYTRRGANNSVTTGQIIFNTTDTVMNLTNMFPVTHTSVNTRGTDAQEPDKWDVAVITITGNTTYAYGVDYTVSIVDVVNATNIPITIQAKQTNLNSGASKVYVKNTSTELTAGTYVDLYDRATMLSTSGNNIVCTGHIAKTAGETTNNVNGTLYIRAFVDAEKVLITDTLTTDALESGATGNNETVLPANTTRVTTADWNNKTITFKVLIVANETTDPVTP